VDINHILDALLIGGNMRKSISFFLEKWAWSVIFLLVINGCAYSKIDNVSKNNGQLRLSDKDLIFVMLSPDGSYGKFNYAGSGRQLSIRILEIIREKYPFAQLLGSTNEIEAMKQAKDLGGTYLISPLILHWEDRLTSWSGYRDKVKVGLRLIRIEPRLLVASNEFESRNNTMTFLDTHPQDLLDEKFKAAVFALFQ
jgi:hypothetical protein